MQLTSSSTSESMFWPPDLWREFLDAGARWWALRNDYIVACWHVADNLATHLTRSHDVMKAVTRRLLRASTAELCLEVATELTSPCPRRRN